MALNFNKKPITLVKLNGEPLKQLRFRSNSTDDWDIVWKETSTNHFTFELINNDTEYKITAADNDELTSGVAIPNYYKNLPVTAIADDVFKGNHSISAVLIPSNIQIIGKNAFRWCINLKTIAFDQNSQLKTIESAAFYNCIKLESLDLSSASSLSLIDRYAFGSCDKLQSVRLNGDSLIVGTGAFRWCTHLQYVDLGYDTVEIASQAFASCWGLKEIYIPGSVEYVGYAAFSHCIALRAILCEDSDWTDWNKIPWWWNPSHRPVHWKVEESAFNYTWVEIDTFDGYYQVEGTGNTYLTGSITIPRYASGLGGVTTAIADEGFKGCTEITEVIIPEGITTIGKRAFKGCTKLRKVTLPSTIVEIDQGAFNGCTRLEEIGVAEGGLPEGLETIGAWAFENCDSLRNIIIPRSVNYVGFHAFGGCKDITITCESISNHLWDGRWSGKNIFKTHTIKWNQSIYQTTDGLNYRLLTAHNIIEVTSYEGNNSSVTIPDSLIIDDPNNSAYNGSYPVTRIGTRAFKGNAITEVSIPNSVTHIGSEAFRECPNLTSITIPDSVTIIGNRAFLDCANLTSVIIDNGVTAIPDHAFQHCYNLTSVTIGNSVKKIGAYAFCGCKSLTYIEIPNSVTSIGDFAFEGCPNLNIVRTGEGVTYGLRSVSGHSNLTSIGNGAFNGCSSLAEMVLPETVVSIGGSAFSGCSALTNITIPKNVTCIGPSAFMNCTSLMQVVFEQGSKCSAICAKAFASCSLLEMVTGLPDPAECEINSNVFEGCDKLANINNSTTGLVNSITGALTLACNALSDLAAADNITALAEGVISKLTTIEKLKIPKNINTIMTMAVLDCFNIKEIYIPSSVKYVLPNAFKGCGTAEARPTIYCTAFKKPSTWANDWNPDNCPVVWGYVDSDAADEYLAYDLIDNNTAYSVRLRDKNNLPGYCLVIPGSYQGIPVTTIQAGGFEGCNISRVEILPGVKKIEDKAFKDCKVMWDINFPDTLEYIGTNAFQNCTALELIQIPDNIKTIKTLAFNNCGTRKDAFGNTGHTMNIYIPSSAQTVEDGAFLSINSANCAIWCEDTAAQLAAKNWGEYWNSSTVLDGLWGTPYTIHYNAAAVTDSSKFEFSDGPDGGYRIQPVDNSTAESMVIVHIPSSYNGKPVTEIGNFGKCKNLVKIILPNTITTIRGGAFSGCRNLNKINLPASLKSIKNYAFGASAYDDYNYTGPSGITEIVIPDTVENSAGDTFILFNGCRQLRHVELPDHWTHLGSRMFDECEMLTDIVIPTDCIYIGTGAFSGCTNLQTAHLYHKYWRAFGNQYNVDTGAWGEVNIVLDLTSKTSEEVATLLRTYCDCTWTALEVITPGVSGELTAAAVEFSISNPNEFPQVATAILSLRDSNNVEIYNYSETYPINAGKVFTNSFDIATVITENEDGTSSISLLEYAQAYLTVHFETSDTGSIVFNSDGSYASDCLVTEAGDILTDEQGNILMIRDEGYTAPTIKLVTPVITDAYTSERSPVVDLVIQNNNSVEVTCYYSLIDSSDSEVAAGACAIEANSSITEVISYNSTAIAPLFYRVYFEAGGCVDSDCAEGACS